MNQKLWSNRYPIWDTALLKVAMLMLFGFCASMVNGQGWERVFVTSKFDEGKSVIQTADRGYVLTGHSQAFGGDGDLDVFVIRTDVDGTVIWTKHYDEGWIEHGNGSIQAADKDFLIIGDIRNTQLENDQVYLLKIGQNGEFRWSKQYGGSGIDQGYDIAATADGGFIIVGRTDSFGNGGDDVYLIKIDALGNEIWSQAYGTSGNDIGYSVIEVADGYVVTGNAYDADSNSDIYLFKTDFDGNEIWNETYSNIDNDYDEGFDVIQTSDGNLVVTGYFDANSVAVIIKVNQNGEELWRKTYEYSENYSDQAYQITEAANGDLVFVGTTEETAFNPNVLIVRTDADGNEIWNSQIGREAYIDYGFSIVQTADGGFVIAGETIQFSAAIVPDITLIKTNVQGNIYSNRLQGYVFDDVEDDCDLGVDDIGLNDWIVKAESSEQTFFGTTDENGFYSFAIDTGDYEVSVLVKNEYWDAQCIPLYPSVLFTGVYDTLTRNFPIIPVVDCPLFEVDLTSPSIQNCTNIGYTVNYCNFGTVESPATTSCEIILDEDLTYISATAPLITQIDSLYVFDIGTVDVDECGTFLIIVETSCDSEPEEDYAVSAHMLPDSLCIAPAPTWDSAFIKVNGYCDVDSVRFNIHNIGDGDMNETLNFIIIEDVVIGLTGDYMLNSDNSIDIVLPADGTTKRIIAEQSAGHPGNSYPTVAIEGCTDGLGPISTGVVTMFQEDENNSFISIDVQESINPGESVANLRGYPKGYPKMDGYDYIKANTDIEYQITFQNTGSHTIQRVVIRDTLSANLDITTVRPGASSHPYDFEIYDNGILKFTFEDIHLPPDSSASSAFGSVKFKVSQKSNLPEGAHISNGAAIFSQYDAPFDSNVKEYKIGGDSLVHFVIISDATEVFVPNVKLDAYPNPFVDAIFFEIEGKTIKEGIFNLYDLNGRLLRQEKFTGNEWQVYRKNLTPGMYVYTIEADNQWIASGKVLVQ